MKVIFLNIEGVLTFDSSEARINNTDIHGIANSCLSNLKHLVDSTGARLVLVSELAKDWNIDSEKCGQLGKYINKKLNRKGLHVMNKIDYQYEDEVLEKILDWLNFHTEVTNYVFLDSAERNGYMYKRVLCNYYLEGLDKNIVSYAERILNE